MQSAPPAERQMDPIKQNMFVLAGESEESVTELAQRLSACEPRRTSFVIPAQLKQFRNFLQECYKYFDESPKTQVASSQTAEWLLDNFYVIEQAIREIEEHLPADFYQRLPKTQGGWLRAYLVALANTRGEARRLDLEALRNFLQTFQETAPLITGEIWALPLMLRLAVLESLAEALAAVSKRTWTPLLHPSLNGVTRSPAVESQEDNPTLRWSLPTPSWICACWGLRTGKHSSKRRAFWRRPCSATRLTSTPAWTSRRATAIAV